MKQKSGGIKRLMEFTGKHRGPLRRQRQMCIRDREYNIPDRS